MTSMLLFIAFCVTLAGGVLGILLLPVSAILAVVGVSCGVYALIALGLYLQFSAQVKRRLGQYQVCMNYKPFFDVVIVNLCVILLSMGMAAMPFLMSESLPWAILAGFIIIVGVIMSFGSFGENRNLAASYVFFSDRGVHFGNDLPSYCVITWEDCEDIGVGVARAAKSQKEVLYFSRFRLEHPEFLSRGNMTISDSFIAIDMTKQILTALLQHKSVSDIRNAHFLPKALGAAQESSAKG